VVLLISASEAWRARKRARTPQVFAQRPRSRTSTVGKPEHVPPVLSPRSRSALSLSRKNCVRTSSLSRTSRACIRRCCCCCCRTMLHSLPAFSLRSIWLLRCLEKAVHERGWDESESESTNTNTNAFCSFSSATNRLPQMLFGSSCRGTRRVVKAKTRVKCSLRRIIALGSVEQTPRIDSHRVAIR
jgi:hypothetical protein